ncbi:uncharacterized protein AMSG_03795 [Thecamonas trahens ATCC 50062]|uniref:F-box domain-containing protein n=1 Tax=Thecamonas trahens ATCC 50062 TaxID=461836 RepID=A0A0L0D5J3_THETB|nr:hypothetical protein AMSG_03795 [Thecamonas trahens ATCC 50062]KNC47361.1 hypothetical protein AMSG_03795 [Thecamonas trahens ATCC 50062]|eukprot:XP_013759699.1 hypothetical protein AMSG_03795 [Thecamonas trahens ATCC 50062]
MGKTSSKVRHGNAVSRGHELVHVVEPPLFEELPQVRGTDDDDFVVHSILVRLPGIVDSVLAEGAWHGPEASATARKAAQKRLIALRTAAAEGHVPMEAAPGAWGRAYCASHGDDADGDQTWLSLPWFHVEHCFYAHMRAIVASAKGSDMFAPHKAKSLAAALPWLDAALAAMPDDIRTGADQALARDALPHYLQLALWGNRGDLSLSAGAVDAASTSRSDADNAAALLQDDSDAWLRAVAASAGTIAIILDNCGHELLADLLLAVVLLRAGVATDIVFYAKAEPVFVSDAMPHDVNAHLEVLAERAPELAALLDPTLDSPRLRVVAHSFFTSPLPFADLAAAAPELAAQLSASAGVITKGDANFRRLIDDRRYLVTTPAASVIDYAWAPLLAVRTTKSPVAIGLYKDAVEAAAERNPTWCVDGSHGMMIFAPRASPEGGLTVADVPIEIWCEIMKFVDWESRIAAGHTCRLLRAAAHDILFWKPHIKRYFPRAIIKPPSEASYPSQWLARLVGERDTAIKDIGLSDHHNRNNWRTAIYLLLALHPHPLFIDPKLYRSHLDDFATSQTTSSLDGWRGTPLFHLAIRWRSLGLFRLLFEVEAESHHGLNSAYVGRTPLIEAAACGHTDMVAELLAAGADCAADPSQAGRTALYWGLQGRYWDMCDMLLQADPNQLTDATAYEMLMRSVRTKDLRLVNYLCMHKAHVVNMVAAAQASIITGAVEADSSGATLDALFAHAPDADVNRPCVLMPVLAAARVGEPRLLLRLVLGHGARLTEAKAEVMSPPLVMGCSWIDNLCAPVAALVHATVSGSRLMVRLVWALTLAELAPECDVVDAAAAAGIFADSNNVTEVSCIQLLETVFPLALSSLDLESVRERIFISFSDALLFAFRCTPRPELYAMISLLLDLLQQTGPRPQPGALKPQVLDMLYKCERHLSSSEVVELCHGLVAAGADPFADNETARSTAPFIHDLLKMSSLWSADFRSEQLGAVTCRTLPKLLHPSDAALGLLATTVRSVPNGFDLVLDQGCAAVAGRDAKTLAAFVALADKFDSRDKLLAALAQPVTTTQLVRAPWSSAIPIQASAWHFAAAAACVDSGRMLAELEVPVPDDILWLMLAPLAGYFDVAMEDRLPAFCAVLVELSPGIFATTEIDPPPRLDNVPFNGKYGTDWSDAVRLAIATGLPGVVACAVRSLPADTPRRPGLMVLVVRLAVNAIRGYLPPAAAPGFAAMIATLADVPWTGHVDDVLDARAGIVAFLANPDVRVKQKLSMPTKASGAGCSGYTYKHAGQFLSSMDAELDLAPAHTALAHLDAALLTYLGNASDVEAVIASHTLSTAAEELLASLGGPLSPALEPSVELID